LPSFRTLCIMATNAMSATFSDALAARVQNRPVIFAFAGEGAHAPSTDMSLIRDVPTFKQCSSILEKLGMDLDVLLQEGLGSHQAPDSVLVTTVINVCLCDLWKHWGYQPNYACGHSVGELAAIYASGMWSLEEVLTAALKIGIIAKRNTGAMLHTKIDPEDKENPWHQSGLSVAAYNRRLPDGRLHVTLCGAEDSVRHWAAHDANASMMRPKHAWHHPQLACILTQDGKLLEEVCSDLKTLEAACSGTTCCFLSASQAKQVTELNVDHWVKWFTEPVDFVGMVTCLGELCAEEGPIVIEMGAHPVLTDMFAPVQPSLHISSMCREQSSVGWILQQRQRLLELSAESFQNALAHIQVNGVAVDPVASFGEQGFTSAQYVQLTASLSTFFPSLKPFDLYRFTSITALRTGFLSSDQSIPRALRHEDQSCQALVVGAGLLLPPMVNSCDELWAALQRGGNAVRQLPNRKYSCGYLDPKAFNAKKAAPKLGIDSAEADVMDPQHVLALHLVARCLEDAGEEVFAEMSAVPDRCGVYLGAWQEQPRASQKPSAYRVLGSSLAAMSSRVANTYNFQGPAITVNTACSSGLVAVNQALQDIRRGVIEFALVGGVNLLTDEDLTADLARARFISPSGACHTFSAEADGYARSEGGVVMLLTRDDGKRKCRAVVCGAATNQNSQRRPMTAVDPVAQERVIRAACTDAGIAPTQLAVVECHGTGTKLGDPVEVSALAATVGRGGNPGTGCNLTAAKMHFGHLESAAGALGFLKAVLVAQRRSLPGSTVQNVNPAVVDAMSKSDMQLPLAEQTKLSEGAFIGISSFGFSGNNAHAVVKVAPLDRTLPFATPDVDLAAYAEKCQSNDAATSAKVSFECDQVKVQSGSTSTAQIHVLLWKACEAVASGISEGKRATESIFDLGMDSLGLAEMLTQVEESFGENAITIEQIMNNPTVDSMAIILAGKVGAVPSSSAASTADIHVLLWKACEAVASGISEGNRASESIFDLGMDSLGLAEMLTQVEEAFGENAITIEQIMSNPTVDSMASILAGRAGDVCTVDAVGAAAASPVVTVDGTIMGGAASVESSAETARSATVLSADSWVRTTHIGSLPRGKPGASLSEVIKLQLDAGMDWINDGEWSRENYISDMLSRIDNMGANGAKFCATTCLCDMPCAADMLDVPIFRRRYTGGNGLITLNPDRVARAEVACHGPVSYKTSQGLYDTLNPFLAAIGDRPRDTCFWSVPSPGTLAVFCENRHYETNREFTAALGEVLRNEYEAIAATGLVLQVDAPDLAMGRHTRFSAMTDDEFADVLKSNVDAINAAVANIDPAQVRVHVCWGNYAGPHHRDLEASKIWPELLRLRARYISIEGANPRHSHDWEWMAENVAEQLIAQDKVLLPGVIDTRCPAVEHPDLICQRILQYARILGPGRVVASTDCGFATTAKSAAVTEDIAWLKIAALTEGARRARQHLINAGSPAPTSMVYSPTGFRAVIIGDVDATPSTVAFYSELGRRAWSLSTFSCASEEQALAQLQFAIDTPMAVVALTPEARLFAQRVLAKLQADRSLSRRPFTLFALGQKTNSGGVVELGELSSNYLPLVEVIQAEMQNPMRFDKRQLVPTNTLLSAPNPDSETDVVIVGAGMLGLLAAVRLTRRGFKVNVLEKRNIVGGIWSMYANSHSQVNSSEGGYSLKDVLGEDGANRDHSTAREMITDIGKLAKEVDSSIFCGVRVHRVLKQSDGGYMVVTETENSGTRITKARGVVLAINDRVGMPRKFDWRGQDTFAGVIASGTNDNLKGVDWRGKHVVVVGMGAFAIENTRTALEHGAEHVTVIVRRHGTVCPKIIDYLNFVKPFDENFQHDTTTNIKQMRQWSALYRQSGATIPECWPEEIKHEGHTISVSDLWFIGHHMGKLDTKVGCVDHFDENGLFLADGSYVEADVVVPCIGFSRNTDLCEKLTGKDMIKNTNYMDKHLMYFADAEIDHGAFNWFFGSSVLEYAKYFIEVYMTGLEHEDEVGELLWGQDVPVNKVENRKWSQYIAGSAKLIKASEAGIPYFKDAATAQVDRRTQHFYKTLPPDAYVQANRQEWIELHTRLNGGKPVPTEKQLPYFFDDAALWCKGTKPL